MASLPQQLLGSLTLQEAASSLTSSVVNSPEGHPQFSFPLTNPGMQSLCTARNSLCPGAGSTHQICVAAHGPRFSVGTALESSSFPVLSLQALQEDGQGLPTHSAPWYH